jgi:probable phosphoglycerate mutase
MIELILIRHGETVYNREERFQGSLDSVLTERGESEARHLGQAMREHLGRVDRWYVSPQGRARQTSEILRAGWEAGLPEEEVHPEICEIRCGDWEGRKRDSIDPDALKNVHFSTNVAYPNGESLQDVSLRCEQFLEDWKRVVPPASAPGPTGDRTATHRTVVVSHGNLIRCMGGVLSGLGPQFAVRALKNNTGVSRFFTRERDYFFRLLSWNDTCHLSGGNPFFAL